MASLSVHLLLDLFNRGPWLAERAFIFPDCPGPIRSIESGTPLADFDFILATAPYEPQYLSLAWALAESDIPPRFADRGPSHPVVIVGGPAPMANPLPLAQLADLVFIGEAEAAWRAMTEACSQWPAEGTSRHEVVEHLSQLDGFWRDGAPGPVHRQITSRPSPSRSLFLAPAAIAEGGLAEVIRGCPHRCRFCMARSIFAPVRPFALADLHAAFEELAEAGAHTIGLVGTSFLDHPQAEDILHWFATRGLCASVPSLRADRLARKPHILKLIHQVGQRTLTIAPEAGTEVLRGGIGKPLSDEALLEVAARADEAGFEGLRLYFMLGLPGETDADADAIADLVERLRAKIHMRISVTLSPFVPKPQTCLEDHIMPAPSTLRRRIRQVAARLRRIGGIDFSAPSLRETLLQAALSRGGLEVAELVVRAASYPPSLAALRRAAAELSIDLEDLARRGSPDRPWRAAVECHNPARRAV